MIFFSRKPRRRNTTILTSAMAPEPEELIYVDTDNLPGNATLTTVALGPNDDVGASRAKAWPAHAARKQLAQNQNKAPDAKPDAERQEKEKRKQDCEEWGKVVENQVLELNKYKNKRNKILQQIAVERQIITAIRKDQLGRPPRSAEQENFIPKPRDIEKDTPEGRRRRRGRPVKNAVPWAGLGRAQNHHAKAKEKDIAEVEKRIEKLQGERAHLKTREIRKTGALPDYHQRHLDCLEKNAP